MKRTVLALIALLIALPCLAGPDKAAPNSDARTKTKVDEKGDPRIDYELSEKCGNSTRKFLEVWKKDRLESWNKPEDVTWSAESSSHYNKRENKCYILITERSVRWRDDPSYPKIMGGAFSSTHNLLYDVIERKLYGDRTVFTQPPISGEHRTSYTIYPITGENNKADWDDLVRRKMEE